MLDTNSLSQCEVVGERKDDDLPCCECGEYGDILIVKLGDCTRDVCRDCAVALGIKW
jgi:hypothetical protein